MFHETDGEEIAEDGEEEKVGFLCGGGGGGGVGCADEINDILNGGILLILLLPCLLLNGLDNQLTEEDHHM